MNLTILLSGSGTNFQAILDAIESKQLKNTSVIKVIADRECQGINRAISYHINHKIVSRKKKDFEEELINEIPIETDLIILAGFLSILPDQLIERFPQMIINIHPSLLPKFGGKGMYGIKVHQSVLDANETESGCTVHYVDKGIDTGKIIMQQKVEVFPHDLPEDLQKRVLIEEHKLLPKAISYLQEQKEIF